MEKNIEVEIRSFVSKDKYEDLLDFFKKEGSLLRKEKQETYYFDCKEDLRIQKNERFSKIWLKKGKIHDECREEVEIKFDKNEFNNLERLFLSLGYKVGIKWFRERNVFRWKNIKVTMDSTKGYGYIVEFEKMAKNQNKKKSLMLLRRKMNELKIKGTSKKEFNEKFEYYKRNWKKLIR